jgi:anti-sigma regulatory factor (Ser/Thr protein kinase)
LFSNIVDLSRLESGDLDLNCSDVDLLKIFSDLENNLGPQADNKRLGLHVQLDPDLPQSVELDESRFIKILYNLVDNAIKFTKSGHISVDANAIPIHGKVNLSINISDTGIGIPEDQVEKVFVPFTQKQDQSINEYGGTGLGLTLTKRLLDAMGGQITVTSEVDSGSTFHVTLDDVVVTDHTPIGEQTRVGASDEATGTAEEPSAWSPDMLTDLARADLPELLVKLAGRESEAADLAETLTINEVDDFATWLKGLGDTFELQPLIVWADMLAQQTSMFEMDSMGDTLKSYPALLDEVRSWT